MLHRNRDDQQFFNVWNEPWANVDGAKFFHGIQTRTMSDRADTGEGTYMVKVPPGWSHVEQADEAALEMFIVEGDVTANGRRVGAGGFVAVPIGCGPLEMTSEGGAQAYVFWNTKLPKDYYYDNQPYVAKVWEIDWILTEMPELRHGIMHKSLRWPDPAEGLLHGGPGGMLRFIQMAPGFGEPRQEVHWDCWEEMVWLTGDLLMPERGMHAGGSYLANPPGMKHGPLTTSKGSLLMLHCDKPMGAEFHDLVDHNGEEMGTKIVQEFQDGQSWLESPSHVDWADRPEHHLYPSSDPKYAVRNTEA